MTDKFINNIRSIRKAEITPEVWHQARRALIDYLSVTISGAKATLRNGSPVVLGISTNDALGLNGMNLMKLLNAKNVYFIPFGQDDPQNKPTSLIADFSKMLEQNPK